MGQALKCGGDEHGFFFLYPNPPPTPLANVEKKTHSRVNIYAQ